MSNDAHYLKAILEREEEIREQHAQIVALKLRVWELEAEMKALKEAIVRP